MVKNAKRLARPARAKAPRFGPVATINTAPVAIGNSLRGSRPRVVNTSDGARVVGRDFAFALAATASTVTGWELIGGMPVTPSVLPSSVLRNYCQMFANFKVNRLVVHYITSSPTSQAGDILFYYERDRKAPMCDYSNASFLPYVLSDPLTIIGPQWTNHSLVVNPVKEWKSTLYGMNSDLNEDAAGSVFLFSKTNATNSPGYVIIDYDISFKEMSVNPRAGTLPISRGQWNQVGIASTALATTAGSTLFGNSANIQLTGAVLNGSSGSLPTGSAAGDVYKCIAAPTASQAIAAWTNVTSSNLLRYGLDASTAILVDDGFTFYMTIYKSGASNVYYFYATLESALAGGGVSTSPQGDFVFGVTATITYNLICNISLVGSRDSLVQSAY